MWVVAEHLVEVAEQMVEVSGDEQIERPAVDLEHLDALGAFLDQRGTVGQVIAQRRHAGAPPDVEQPLHLTVIFEPQRDRRDVENGGDGIKRGTSGRSGSGHLSHDNSRVAPDDFDRKHPESVCESRC